eukprot:tig00000241_g20889.t1
MSGSSSPKFPFRPGELLRVYNWSSPCWNCKQEMRKLLLRREVASDNGRPASVCELQLEDPLKKLAVKHGIPLRPTHNAVLKIDYLGCVCDKCEHLQGDQLLHDEFRLIAERSLHSSYILRDISLDSITQDQLAELANEPLFLPKRDRKSEPQASSSRSSGAAKITACPHTDAKHYAHGMCGTCYRRIRLQNIKKREKIDNGTSEGEFNGSEDEKKLTKVTNCPHRDAKHYAHGLCNSCYRKERAKRAK